jgi:hypothetical protein
MTEELMKNGVMDRKSFLRSLGKAGACAGACACAAAGGLRAALAFEPGQAKPGDKTTERAVKWMDFADMWIKRFFDVMDQTLDVASRTKLMMANGKTCYRDWIRESKQEVKKIDFATWAEKAARTANPEELKIEGNVVHFQFQSSAETGQGSPESVCLCPMVESKPSGMSPTYCLCSVGYVKEMQELRFGRKAEVELLDSVLKGGKRCKFKITMLNPLGGTE